MDRFNKKFQILKLSLIVALIFMTPLLSTSQRPTYIYFIINLLIIALGAEAGLLSSFFSKPPSEDKKTTTFVVNPKAGVISSEAASPVEKEGPGNTMDDVTTSGFSDKRPKVVEKSASEKKAKVGPVEMNLKVKKCPSSPSLFFIGGGETETDEVSEDEHEEEGEEFGGLNGQELFTRAEIFIGNFYKQLKMQREDSWKKIHGFYHKAF